MTTPSAILAPVCRLLRSAFPHTDPNRSGSSYAVTVITPIKSGQTEKLKRVLDGFRPPSTSPLAKLPDVQFARWVVIDHLRTDWPGCPQPTPRLQSEYLLFSADVTPPVSRAHALPEAFFRDLAVQMAPEAAEVWGKCRGCPAIANVDAFVKYLTDSQIEIGLYYAAYPDATTTDIRRALSVRKELASFAIAHPRPRTANTLKAEYFKASDSWGI